MHRVASHNRNYVIAAALGALAGGALTAIVLTRAIPAIMSELMPRMMQRMMARMRESGCEPGEM